MTPELILKTMMDKDYFSQWMGLDVLDIREGFCRLKFTVKEEMLNGFGIVHGGIIFGAADSAFAFACNSHGRVSVALDVAISFLKPSRLGETLTVEANEIHTGYKTSFYDITITNEEDAIVSVFKGTAYRTSNNVIDETSAPEETPTA